VVSRAGWPDQLHSDHALRDLGSAAMLHAGRPTVVTVGAGAAPLTATSAVVPAAQEADEPAPHPAPRPTHHPAHGVAGTRP
jgi:uroporphyrin-III C-methyltransferase